MHMCTSPHTYVLVICILKSALTNRWNCKISEKVLSRKRINAGGGVKAYPLGVGFWCHLLSGTAEAASSEGAAQTGAGK